MKLTRMIAPLAISIAALAATPASAAMVVNPNGTLTITNPVAGDTATLNFDGNAQGNTVAGLTSALTLSFASATANSITFNYTLANTSTNPTTASRVNAFGLDASPDISGATATGPLSSVLFNPNMPNNVGTVEVCFSSNACAGGGGGGVSLGAAAATGQLTLNFNQSFNPLTLSNFAVRYQAVDTTGLQGASATGRLVVSAVPEPGTWALMLLGFGAVGYSLRRRRFEQPGLLQLA